MLRFLLALTIAAVSNLTAADLSGRWTGTMESNGGRVRIFVTLNLFDPSTGEQQHAPLVSGTVATGDEAKPVPIEKGEIQGETVTFQVHDNAGRIVKFKLSMTGAVLGGEAEVGGQTSKVSISRSGIGVGIGSGSGDRLRPGVGTGIGSGEGVGAGVYKVGGGVSAPVVIHKVDPEYTEEARTAKYQGTVLLSVEIDPNGTVTNIRVVRSLGLGLDEKAIEAVRQWKFKPGTKNGEPVTVAASIEVNFRL